MTEFISKRSARFEYAAEAVDHIEEHNCSLGCSVPGDASEEAPGGSCLILLRVISEESTSELIDGDPIRCTARQPIPETPETFDPPPDTDRLF